MASMTGVNGNGPLPAQPPDGPPKIPQDKIYTEYELEMVQAAMMEELGNGRKEALPLEDRKGGARDNRLKPVADYTGNDDRKAAWRNFEHTVDDVDPNKQAKDIARGNLYRMRREAEEAERRALGLSPLRGDHNSLRGGRGGRGGRVRHGGHGGYAYNPGRGGSSTGAYTRPSSNLRGHGVTNHGPSTSFQVIINDARGAAHGHPQTEAIVARIRSANPPASATRGCLGGRSRSAFARQAPRDPSLEQFPVDTIMATSEWGKNLATAQDGKFMTWGTDTPSSKPDLASNREPTAVPVASQAPHLRALATAASLDSKTRNDVAAPAPPAIPVVVNLPAAASSITHVAPHLLSAQETSSRNNQVPTDRKTGLSNSRWATDTSDDSPTQMAGTAAESASNSSREVAPLTHNTILTSSPAQRPSKDLVLVVSNNDPAAQPLRVHTTKVTENNGQCMSGKAMIFDHTRHSPLLTLQLEQQGIIVLTEEVSDEAAWILSARNQAIIYQASKVSSKWTIQFTLPAFVQVFYDVILTPRKARGIPTQTRNPFEIPRTSSANAAPLLQVSSASPVGQIIPLVLSRSASSYYDDGTNGSIRTHNEDMNEVGGIENLVDVGDVPQSVEETRTLPILQEFIEDKGEDFLIEAFSQLTQNAGNVLEQISALVIIGNGTPASFLSANDILASDQYADASSKLLGTLLDMSPSFKTLSDVWTLRIVEVLGPRILKRAVEECYALEPAGTVDKLGEQDDDFEDFNAQVTDQALADNTKILTIENQNLCKSESHALTERPISPQIHVVGQNSYPVEALLGFRDAGVAPQFGSLSNNVLHLFRSGVAAASNVSEEKSGISTTRNRVPHFGGLSEPSSTSATVFLPPTCNSQCPQNTTVESNLTGGGDTDEGIFSPQASILEALVKDFVSTGVQEFIQKPVQIDEKNCAQVEIQSVIIPQEPLTEKSTCGDGAIAPFEGFTETSSVEKVAQPQAFPRGRHAPTNSEWERLTETFQELSVDTDRTETDNVPRAVTASRKKGDFVAAVAQSAVDKSKDPIPAVEGSATFDLTASLKVESLSKEIKNTSPAQKSHLVGARELPKPSSSKPKVGLANSRWATPEVLPAPGVKSSKGTPIRPTAAEFRPYTSGSVQQSASTPDNYHHSSTAMSDRPRSDEFVPELKKGIHNSAWANKEISHTPSLRSRLLSSVPAVTPMAYNHTTQPVVHATVKAYDPNTGQSQQVTGPLLRVGSMLTTIPTQGQPALRENSAFQVPAHSHRHHHSSSSGSSVKSPEGVGSTYQSRGENDFATSSQPRSALSPIRQGENATQP